MLNVLKVLQLVLFEVNAPLSVYEKMEALAGRGKSVRKAEKRVMYIKRVNQTAYTVAHLFKR